jgi:hypothetical protein
VNKVIFALLLVISSQLCAKPITWFDGVIVLNDNSVIAGKLAVEFYYNVILFKSDSATTVFPAGKIRSLMYYDKFSCINRKFISLDFDNKLNYPKLYEVVLDGNAKLIRRLNYNYRNQIDEARDYSYFIYFAGEINSVRKFRHAIWPKLVNHSTYDLKVYVNNQSLDLYQLPDIVQVLQYYNRLVSPMQAYTLNNR